MQYSRTITWFILSVVLFTPLVAATQYEGCSQLVQTALEATNDVCEATSRNSACYGHVKLDAEAQPGFGPFKFDEVGDTVNVAHLNTLRLSPMDMTDGTWGVALLRLQADIPDDKPQNVNLLLFGDVEVQNLAPEPVLLNVTMNSTGNVNVRRDPESTAFVMGTIMKGATVTARGRSEDNAWIYVDMPGTGDKRGWILRTFVRSNEDLDTLNVVQPNLSQYGPMQAFYLKTGSKQSSCAEAPNDGLLVQTPEGVAEVRLWINEVKIRLGSTAFITSSPGNQMTIKTLEGAAHVEALGVEQVAVAGTGVTVQLNQHSGASAPPSAPKPYTSQDIQNLPVDNLDRDITPVITDEANAGGTSATPTEEVASDEPASPTVTDVPPRDTDVPTVVPPTNTDIPEPTIEPTLVPTDEPSATPVPPTDVPPAPPTDEPTQETQTRGEPTADNPGSPPSTQEPPSSPPETTPS
jgi:hypothetical protein